MTRTNPPLRALEISHQMLDQIAPLLEPIGTQDRALMDQLRRAAQSVTLNLAESAGHRRGNRRVRLETALGSLYETRACLRIARSWGYVDAQAADAALTIVDRVGALTYRVLHPRR